MGCPEGGSCVYEQATGCFVPMLSSPGSPCHFEVIKVVHSLHYQRGVCLNATIRLLSNAQSTRLVRCLAIAKLTDLILG